MTTAAAQAALGAATVDVARGERRRLQREQRGAAEDDDAREESVRVVAHDPRVQAPEEPQERERGER